MPQITPSWKENCAEHNWYSLPVCGDNGQTYKNKALADCEEVVSLFTTNREVLRF